MSSEYAMLPINSLLFPYGHMRLAFFEPRYLDIARESLATQQPFVLACIDPIAVRDPDFPATHDLAALRKFAMQAKVLPIGSTVNIIDFEVGQHGVLTLLLEARQRIFIETTQQRADNLRMCAGELIANPKQIAPLPEFGLFVELLSKTYDDIKLNHNAQIKLDDAFWVLGRMVELLELPLDLQWALISPQNPNQALQLMLDNLVARRVEHS